MNNKKMKYGTLRFKLILIVLSCLKISSLSIAYADQQRQKTLLEQLEEEEKKERISNIHQGPSKRAAESLQNARDNAQVNVNSCAAGAVTRKIEDVKEYITRQEDIQIRIAASLERFTSKIITRNQAIDELNGLIIQSNEIVTWGRGKVTDGTCGPIKQTEIISKSIGATKFLIQDYKKALNVK
jgi:hypothetical protein